MKAAGIVNWALGLLAVALVAHAEQSISQSAGQRTSPYKVLHIMSYHSPWRWTDGQLDGFKEALQGVEVEYQVFQMDTKRHSAKEEKEKKGRRARELIETWKPDLVYTSDDDAQEYVTKYYIDQDLPFVFSGVNKDPKAYGFERSKNVTGVLEQEHFVESVRLLKAVVPHVTRVAAVFDDASLWQEPVKARMRERMAQIPDVQIVAWDTIRTYDDYQRKIKEYPGKADAIALIGVFNFKDANGKDVPYQDALKWTAENSRLPDFSFWIDRAYYGTLCVVNVSEREQGLAAGRLARAILIEGRSPSSLPMKPTVKGTPVINLARAKKLGIKVKSGVLLSSEVIEKFEWDN
jgi:ABC-type uncharacterized transport system substrate-binding protein